MKKIIYQLYKALFLSFSNNNKIYFRGDEKSGLEKLIDQIRWIIKEHRHSVFYYAFALNIKGSKQSRFFGKRGFRKIILENQKKLLNKNQLAGRFLNYDIVTKDKFYTTSILKSQNIPVVDNIGLISNGRIYANADGSEFEVGSLFKNFKLPLVIKNSILEYNEGLCYIEEKRDSICLNGLKKNREEIINFLRKGNWVIQKPEISSAAIRTINNSALNVTRIVTFMKDGKPYFLGGFQSFATGSQKTDSWGKGSVYVGFDLVAETLHNNGYFHPMCGNKSIVNEHPDSNIRFGGYKIKGLKNAVEICLKAHSFFYSTYIIGWDVAITDQGPKILEANEEPGMNAMQCIDKSTKINLIIQN